MSIYIGKNKGKNSHFRFRISDSISHLSFFVLQLLKKRKNAKYKILNRNAKYEIRNAKSVKGFSLMEVLITMSLFLLTASMGIGAYFQYYQTALVNADIDSTLTLMKDTRFKALKNPTNSNYGIHIDSATSSLISFRETYTPGLIENIVVELEQLDIKSLDLAPNIGATNEILFEKQTGKTQNSGTFTIGNLNTNHTFNINVQGVIN